MQIVIDIPEDVIEGAKSSPNFYPAYHFEKIWRAIAKGIPLPKGHGNIYDENDIKKGIENPYQCQTVLYGLELVKPIIEADKESEDKE